jgi:hypothetical protein
VTHVLIAQILDEQDPGTVQLQYNAANKTHTAAKQTQKVHGL